MVSRLSKENLVLYPAVYNKRGLLGDFEVYVLEADGSAYPLSGRVGPYTSVEEWFEFAGKDIIGKEPDEILVALRRELPAQVYRVGKGDVSRLEELAQSLNVQLGVAVRRTR